MGKEEATGSQSNDSGVRGLNTSYDMLCSP